MSANPITVYGPAPTDNEGVLTKWVQQPTDNIPHESKDLISFTEKWKGPYNVGKDILSHICYNDGITLVHNVLGGDRIKRFDPPDCPTRWSITGEWRVNTIDVQELESGSHCILTIEYYANYGGWESSTLKENPKYDVWTISWQSYSVSPYAFCSDQTHTDNIQSPVGEPEQPTFHENNAMRSHIQHYLNNPVSVLSSESFPRGNVYVYASDPTEPDRMNALTPAEGVILEKVQMNRQATYHYPILIHQTVKTGEGLASYDEDIGEDIDHIIDNLPSDCPYQFPSNEWTWVKTGDEMEQKKTELQVQYTRKEIFQGFKGVDLNFYGNTEFNPNSKEGLLSSRWEIGKL